jgi:hypothetical protein
MVQKAEVEIKEKEKSPSEQAMDKVLKQLEIPVQPPPIEETLKKAKQALAQAEKAKTPVKQTWYCTDCGGAHIQNDGMDMGLGHISVDCVDGDFVDPSSGTPLTGKPLTLMTKYAAPKVKRGEGHNASTNNKTLAKMRELKGER